MTRRKLERFADITAWDHVLEPRNTEYNILDFIDFSKPLIVELACGQGAYTVSLAKAYPDHTCVGIDIKGNRIWFGAKQALDESLENVRFIRTDIESLTAVLPRHCIDELWITFPDPHLRGSRAKKRLTSPRFLSMYKELLKPEGSIHLKTDSPTLYYYTHEVSIPSQSDFVITKSLWDVYHQPEAPSILTSIQTPYEVDHLAKGRKVYWVEMRSKKQSYQ